MSYQEDTSARRARFETMVRHGRLMAEEATFWSRVTIAEDGCWIWTASYSAGYGQFVYKGTSRRATHVALLLDGRPIPFDGAVARHRCDNRACVNPGHLEWGTTQQNVRDAIERGRFSFASLRARHGRQRAARLAVKCAHCGKVHTKTKNKIAISKRVYCSPACHYAARASKTHCKSGHEFTPSNTYADSKGARRCRACNRDSHAAAVSGGSRS